MHTSKRRLMGKLLYDNRWYFLLALLCTVVTIVIEFVTPIVLAETLDYYLQGKPSRMPAFVNAWVDSLGGTAYMARNLWIVGLVLVGLNILSGIFPLARAAPSPSRAKTCP